MGTIAVQTIINRVSLSLIDITGVRWAPAELLDYLNMSIRGICTLKPDAFVKNGAFQLIAGSKQTIPTDGTQFLRLTRNMGAAGNTPGRVITMAEMQALDDVDVNWHTSALGAPIYHYLFDMRDPLVFYVYPQAVTQVDLVYAAAPTAVLLGGTIPIPDIYDEAIYVLTIAYALAKNTKDGDFQKSIVYWNRFSMLLNIKDGKQAMFDPRMPPKANNP